jgi:MFS family permease
MQADFRLNELQLGLLLALNSLGYLLACSFTGRLVRNIGLKWTNIAAFISMALSGLFIYRSTGFGSLSASYFLLNVGNGLLEIGLGILAARIFTKNTGTMMNLAHFFYGLSSAAAPIAASSMMGWTLFGGELGWRGMYAVMLSLSLVPVIPALLGKFAGDAQHSGAALGLKSLYKDKTAWLIIAVLTFGVVAELAVGGWLVNFLEKVYHWSTSEASAMLSLFFVFFMLSRLLVGPFTDKLGYTLSVILLSGFFGVCSLAAIAVGEKAAVLLAVAGIGIAPIYPTVMALIAKRYPNGTEAAITFIVTVMGIGSVIGNFLIGAIIDIFQTMLTASLGSEAGVRVGMQAGYVFIAVLSLCCAAFGILLHKRLRHR